MTDKELITINNFKITSADADMYGRIRLGSLVNLFIQAATNSADSLGFGFKNIRHQQLFWVLSRVSVEIYEQINWNDEIVVETWPKNLDKILYLRDFILKDNSEKVLAKATSGWLAIDIEKKRPNIIEGLDAEKFYRLKNKHAIKEVPEKLFQTKIGHSFDKQAKFSDIDVNKHVTSTRYIDWIMDTIPTEFHQHNYPKKLSINYLKETMPDNSIEIIQNQSENIFVFEGLNCLDKTPTFRAKIEF